MVKLFKSRNMKIKLKFWLSLVLIFFHQNALTNATLYAFLIEDPEIFQDCKDQTNYLGVADMLDLSNLNVELFDDTVHIEGSITMLWDADPNDRVELTTEVFKYQRGSWQPTVFTLIEKDFCTALFDKHDIWYRTWAQYIDPDDMKCITNKGHIYHHVPFDLETEVDIRGNDMSGRHKIVIKIDAYDMGNNKQPYSVCLEAVGDLIKK